MLLFPQDTGVGAIAPSGSRYCCLCQSHSPAISNAHKSDSLEFSLRFFSIPHSTPSLFHPFRSGKSPDRLFILFSLFLILLRILEINKHIKQEQFDPREILMLSAEMQVK